MRDEKWKINLISETLKKKKVNNIYEKIHFPPNMALKDIFMMRNLI